MYQISHSSHTSSNAHSLNDPGDATPIWCPGLWWDKWTKLLHSIVKTSLCQDKLNVSFVKLNCRFQTKPIYSFFYAHGWMQNVQILIVVLLTLLLCLSIYPAKYTWTGIKMSMLTGRENGFLDPSGLTWHCKYLKGMISHLNKHIHVINYMQFVRTFSLIPCVFMTWMAYHTNVAPNGQAIKRIFVLN